MIYLEELIDYDVNGKAKKMLLIDSISEDLAEREDLGIGSLAYVRGEDAQVHLKTVTGWEVL